MRTTFLLSPGFRWPAMAATCAAGLAISAIANAAAAPKPAVPSRTASVTAGVTILKPVTIATGQSLSSGSIITTSPSASGTVVIPASYPTLTTPAPTYSGAKPSAIAGRTTNPASARIDITGVANTSVTVKVTGWTQVSGGAPAPTVSATTFYSPSYGTKTAAIVVLNAQGKGSLHVGATLTITAGSTARVFTFNPVYSVNYN